MACLNFEIPANKNELYSTGDNYCVKSDIGPKELPSALKNARTAFREEGAEYIIENFDIYYSVLHHVDKLSMDVIHQAYEDLHKAALKLNNSLGFLLEDKDSLNEELRMKYQNVLKMLIYLYTEIIISIEQRHMAKDDQLIKVRKKSSKDQDDFTVDKKSSLLILNNIIQRDISLFWDPPIVEEKFINRICAVCYEFLEKTSIKSCKDELCEIFNLFGYLMKNYNYGSTFVIRITQLVKTHEHLGQCLPKGIQQIVQEFNCKGLLHELIEELTEWQVDDKHNDAQGSRLCSVILSSLAALLPDLMIPEITSLNVYLHYEPPALRVSVLMVMVEVVLNNLTSHTLSEDQKEFRDRLFNILMEHIDDNAVLVRSKVLGQMARLQKETAIPLKFQLQILELAVAHLHDKGVLVRKYAVNCVTTFLAYNAYSASLSLAAVQEKLDAKSKELKSCKEQLADPKVEELIALQSKWDTIVDKLQNFVENEINNDEKENEEENADKNINVEQVSTMLKNLLTEYKFKEAFKLCKTTLRNSKFLEGISGLDKMASHDVSLYMTIFYTCFFDVSKVMKQIGNREFRTIIPEDYKKFETLTKEEQYLKDCVNFLKQIDRAIDLMVDLLDSVSITDMHEAIGFFVAAYQFQIDRAETGILAMLKLMQRNEQERKDAVIEAFKTIFLKTDANNMMDHCVTIINRLIKLLKSVPVNNIDDLEEIISNWCSKGILDNAVIDKLWRYVTQQLPVSSEDECTAMDILRMCAIGRKTIAKSNLNLVLSIASSDRAKTNMVFFGACCKMLAVAYEKVDVNSAKPPFRLSADDDAFKNVLNILQDNFFAPIEYFNKGLYGAIDFIYKLCKKPETVCEILLNYVYSTLYNKQQKKEKIPDYILIRVCQMCGYMALKELEFMDDTIYKELKRRQNLRDEREKGKKKSHKNSSKLNATDMTVVNEKTVLEGAQAEDTDADFILNVLENDTVTGSGGLAKLSPWIVTICEQPAIFTGKELQACAITAMMRYMLVSSTFCSQHIRLIFTIFSRTNYSEVKKNILVHLYDMLIRFPNIVEPWTPKIFENLNDPSVEIRRPTFFILTSLILRDLIRAHSHIPEMALCLVDEDEVLRGMCKTFFVKLAHKENNLYNALPDIYTHVILQDKIDDEGVHRIMSFLFEQIENSKHMESLVDRFCSKFQLTDDIRQQRNTSYCLTLIKYNEKALKKLIDNFPMYKHILHDEHIYSSFRSIMQDCSKTQVGKPDLKTTVAELENLIKSVFELDNNGSMAPPIIPPKSAKKPRKKKTVSNKRSVNSDEDIHFNNTKSDSTPVKRSTRLRKKTVATSDSD